MSAGRGREGPSEAGQAETEGPFLEALDPSFWGFAYISGRCSSTCSYWANLATSGNAGVMEHRTLAAASVEEAVRTAKDIVLNTPVPGIYGFRLTGNGLEVFHWLIGQGG
jgi:hypothetical protein